jgi:hypothetical protein
MILAIILGVAAFVLLGVMFALLGLSSRKENSDPVTQEIIVKAHTGPVHVHGPVIVQPTQEDKD